MVYEYRLKHVQIRLDRIKLKKILFLLTVETTPQFMAGVIELALEALYLSCNFMAGGTGGGGGGLAELGGIITTSRLPSKNGM